MKYIANGASSQRDVAAVAAVAMSQSRKEIEVIIRFVVAVAKRMAENEKEERKKNYDTLLATTP